MSHARLFAIVGLVGIVAVAALTVRNMVVTPAAAETAGTSIAGTGVAGIIALHERQERADTSSAIAGVEPGNLAQGIVELHKRQELVDSGQNSGAANVQAAQGIIELHRHLELADSAVSSAGSQAGRMVVGIMRLHDRLERTGQGQ